MWGKKRKSRAMTRTEFLTRVEAEARVGGAAAAFEEKRRAHVAQDGPARAVFDVSTQPSEPSEEKTGPNPEHVAKLKEGVQAWNAWRNANPDIEPDLRYLDLTTPEWRDTALRNTKHPWRAPLLIDCSNANFSNANLWKANFSGTYCSGTNFSRAIFDRANFSTAYCGNANFEGAYCEGANFTNAACEGAVFAQAFFEGANFSSAYIARASFSRTRCPSAIFVRANCSRTDFSGADCNRASFKRAECLGAYFIGSNCPYTNFADANCEAANFSGGIFDYADFTRTQISLANLQNTRVVNIQYNKNFLEGRCHGVRAAECYGDANFRRLVMDQDYIDQLESQVAPRKRANIKERFRRIIGGFAKRATWVGGVMLGLFMVALTCGTALFDGPGLWANLPALLSGGSFPVLSASLIAGSIAVVGFFLGKTGQYSLFRLWGWFDYGRDWDRVVIFAGVIIGVFGGLYAWLSPEHIAYLQYDPTDTEQRPIWFYPWFVALMGFATLGVTDIAAPLTPTGALVMMGNVLAGFVTLGLLLSVLGDKFARRA
jgi:uncharacterized protein YjbI with pentapeptide repeats